MQQDNNFNIGIVVNEDVGHAQFATIDTPDQVFRAFPSELHVLESFDQLTYDQVYDHLFTDKFFDLSPAILDNEHLEAANQRCTYANSEGAVVVCISLPGRMAPNEKMHLYTNAVAAGYTMGAILEHGLGACVYSEFTIHKDL